MSSIHGSSESLSHPRHNVDPGVINPSRYYGGVPSKSDESPLKGDTPLLINPGFTNPGFTLNGSGTGAVGFRARAGLRQLGAAGPVSEPAAAAGFAFDAKPRLFERLREPAEGDVLLPLVPFVCFFVVLVFG